MERFHASRSVDYLGGTHAPLVLEKYSRKLDQEESRLEYEQRSTGTSPRQARGDDFAAMLKGIDLDDLRAFLAAGKENATPIFPEFPPATVASVEKMGPPCSEENSVTTPEPDRRTVRERSPEVAPAPKKKARKTKSWKELPPATVASPLTESLSSVDVHPSTAESADSPPPPDQPIVRKTVVPKSSAKKAPSKKAASGKTSSANKEPSSPSGPPTVEQSAKTTETVASFVESVPVATAPLSVPVHLPFPIPRIASKDMGPETGGQQLPDLSVADVDLVIHAEDLLGWSGASSPSLPAPPKYEPETMVPLSAVQEIVAASISGTGIKFAELVGRQQQLPDLAGAIQRLADNSIQLADVSGQLCHVVPEFQRTAETYRTEASHQQAVKFHLEAILAGINQGTAATVKLTAAINNMTGTIRSEGKLTRQVLTVVAESNDRAASQIELQRQELRQGTTGQTARPAETVASRQAEPAIRQARHNMESYRTRTTRWDHR